MRPAEPMPSKRKNIIKETKQHSGGILQTEVKCNVDNVHLGYVYNDGPDESRGGTGKRYCVNSAVLKFTPLHELTNEERLFYFDTK